VWLGSWKGRKACWKGSWKACRKGSAGGRKGSWKGQSMSGSAGAARRRCRASAALRAIALRSGPDNLSARSAAMRLPHELLFRSRRQCFVRS
jgi:hypothetical protein